ncbi:hypothetical protein MKW98_003096 [Papaver atlanticum]|uniref:Uncharacterized protein n=1 Tax=Papaver atlanticum TaxID=357466 RepID=A0AAD4XUN2_9MAGN|nr:hypothetical protein MKW98_003096 [Papaver atlanticum]
MKSTIADKLHGVEIASSLLLLDKTGDGSGSSGSCDSSSDSDSDSGRSSRSGYDVSCALSNGVSRKVSKREDAHKVYVASDGLWDYTKSSDTVKFVWNQLWLHRVVQLACEALSQATLG